MKWRSFEKMAIFDILFTFLVTRKNTQKLFQHISYLYIHEFGSSFDFFCLANFAQNFANLSYRMWFLFGTNPNVDSHSRHLGAINELQNGKILVSMSTTNIYLH